MWGWDYNREGGGVVVVEWIEQYQAPAKGGRLFWLRKHEAVKGRSFLFLPLYFKCLATLFPTHQITLYYSWLAYFVLLHFLFSTFFFAVAAS